MEYFKRFTELKQVEQQGLVVKPLERPKITVVMTYEQVLFEIAGSIKDAESWRRLSEQIKAASERSGSYYSECEEEIDKSIEMRRLKEKLERVNDDIDFVEAFEREKEITERMLEREDAYTRDDVNFMEARHQYRLWKERVKELRAKISSIPVTITRESPIENILIYGALDYTVREDHNTNSISDNLACIKSLEKRLIEDISDYDNDEIAEIIVFSGMYGEERAYYAAQFIQDTRELEPGIVKVYSTMSINPPIGLNVTVLHKERRDIASRIMSLQGLDKVTRVIIPAGRETGEIKKIISGEYA